MQTVAIQYGIFGGPRRGKEFRAELAAQGYKLIPNSHQADILIAHSAGCFWLPPSASRQKLLLIDPPYWPGKTIAERSRARASSNLHFWQFSYPLSYWLVHNLWGLYYGLARLSWHIKVLRFASSFDLEKTIAGRRLLLIRNEHDNWLTPDFEKLKSANPGLQTRLMPGDHDNCWFNPKPYIALLKDLPS